MADLPLQEELLDRKKQAEAKLEEARLAYDNFLKVWDQLAQEEVELLRQLQGQVDKSKLYSVLQKIDNIKH